MSHSWSAGGNLTTARNSNANFGTKTAGMTCGGDSGGVIASTETYNGTAWSAGGNLPTAKKASGGCGSTSAGLICGGYTTTYVNTTELYNGTTWSGSANLIVSRYSHGSASAAAQSSALVFGGFNNTIVISSEKFNGTSWASAGNMPASRYYNAGAGTQTAGMSIAGLDSGSVNSAAVYTYNGTAWSTGTSVNTARGYLSGFGASSSDAICAGGYATALSGATEYWNGTTWANDNSLATARYLISPNGGGVSSSGFVTGGNTGTNLNSTEILTLVNSASFTMSGGGIGGGTVATTRIKYFTMSGGGIGGGAASYQSGASNHPAFTMAGGGIGGGSATYIKNIHFTMAGGGIGGGAAAYTPASAAKLIDLLWGIFDNNNNPITGGAASTALKIRRDKDGYLYDWNSNTFKASAWTALSIVLMEENATNLAGYYKRVVDISNATVWPDGWYQAFTRYTGTPARNGDIEFYVYGGQVTQVVVAANSARLAQIPTNPLLTTDTRLNNMDATISSRLAASADPTAALNRILGLSLENRVEDTITYDGSGRKTGSILWLYDSAAHATLHDGVTGLVAKYQTSFAYDTQGRMSLDRITRLV